MEVKVLLPTRFSLKNAVAIFITAFLLIVAGTYSFKTMKMDMLPNVEIPQLLVQITYPGASPEDVDEQIMKKTDKELMNIEGVKSVNGTAMNNVAVYQMEFNYGEDMDKATSKVSSILEKHKFPTGVETKVDRISMDSIPIYFASLYGNDDITNIVSESVIPALEKIEGIGNITTSGQKERVVNVVIDQQKAFANGLTMQSIKEGIEKSNFGFPAGAVNVKDQIIPIHVKKEMNTTEELKKVVFESPQGTVTLADIATIETKEQASSYSRTNEKEAINIQITKKQNANTVETVKEVKKVIDEYKKKEKFDVIVGFSQGEEIEKSINSLVKEGLFGALFASLAVLLFLRNIRATIIAIISIPLSLLITSIFLKQMDITLNMMSLGGMAVAVGRVVDDSIVVIENIFRRVRKHKGAISNDLIIDSTKEILHAIASSTVVTAIVFLPIGLVTGMVGEMFYPFAITVVVSLLASLLVAVTIVPILAKFSFSTLPKEEKEGKLQRGYEKALHFSLKRKWIVLLVSFILLISSFGLVSKVGFVMMPNESQKLLFVTAELPPSTTLEKSNDISQKIEKMLLDRKSTDGIFATVGGVDMQTGITKPNQLQYYVNFKKSAVLEDEQKELQKEVEKTIQPEVEKSTVQVLEMSSGTGSDTVFYVDLFDSNLERLQENTAKVEEYVAKQKPVKEASNNFKEKQTQWSLVIDGEKAAKAGIPNEMILGLVAEKTNPVSISSVFLDKKEQNIFLSYKEKIQSKEDIENIMLPTKTGLIPLKEIAAVKDDTVYNSIQKKDGKVFARVTAKLNSTNIQKDTLDLVNGIKNDAKVDKEVKVQYGGSNEEMNDSLGQMGMAMLVALGLVYVVMLLTFKKARIPFVILTSLLFVPIGAFSALFITGEPFSMSSMIGLLMLIGIVTTNAIVLVDRIGQNRLEKDMKIRESILEAGKTRLNPILMTALATIAALMPLALSTSEGTLISKGLAIVVIGGLASSTLLTLFVVPVIYELFHFRKNKKELNEQVTKQESKEQELDS